LTELFHFKKAMAPIALGVLLAGEAKGAAVAAIADTAMIPMKTRRIKAAGNRTSASREMNLRTAVVPEAMDGVGGKPQSERGRMVGTESENSHAPFISMTLPGAPSQRHAFILDSLPFID